MGKRHKTRRKRIILIYFSFDKVTAEMFQVIKKQTEHSKVSFVCRGWNKQTNKPNCSFFLSSVPHLDETKTKFSPEKNDVFLPLEFSGF